MTSLASSPPGPAGRPTASPTAGRGSGSRPSRALAPLAVAGMTSLSTVDWPGHLVATVFLQGCPWRCTYCHSRDLAPTTPADTEGPIAWPDVVTFLERQRDRLDGVVFSGGEPTLQAALPAAIADVRELGLAVGLHTAGPWPVRLEHVLPLVDWVGLDIKHLPEDYELVTGARPSGDAAYRSLAVLQRSGVEYEVRTTVDPTVHSRGDVLELCGRLAALGVRGHVLQEAHPLGTDAAYAAALAGMRLSDVLHDDDLPQLERRT
ncbi:anaerobic ribonucleoside-triphosphate reductase activating protein [Oerskovia sp. NPDC060338]|uniref:anaerobic ribonucleoside-triphosphate reductase activating protein n=1 Tax=Oerskovia sp. NPDC060338 TaxID=3347100 RepID=UPI003668B34B